MKFTIEIGETQKTLVHFSFNQLFGEVKISVNDKVVRRSCRLFSEPLFDAHELELDDWERSKVRIEKERQLLFASTYRVYVNSRLTQVLKGA